MQSKAASVDDYLKELPEDRRAAISKVRQVIRKNLPKGVQEGMQYGMIGYFIPHKVYPKGYHCDPKQPLPFAALASQKNHMSVYLCTCYGVPEHENWIREEFARRGKKIDMGKSCIRFRKVQDLALDVLGEAVGRVDAQAYIAHYESVLARSKSAKKK